MVMGMFDAEKVKSVIVQVMQAAELPKSLIYAFERTGCFVREGGNHTPQQEADWNAAIEEWEQKYGSEATSEGEGTAS
jgi:hypothetical protein